MQATLPSYLEEIEVEKGIKEGQYFYVTPWLLRVDLRGQLWLDLSNSTCFKDQARGTVSLKVTKLRYGYSVDFSKCLDYRWKRELFSTNKLEAVQEITGV
jgi:hypothetical protein